MSTVMKRICEVILVIDDRVEGVVRPFRKIFLSALDVKEAVRLSPDLPVENSVPQSSERVTLGLTQKSTLVQMFVRVVLEMLQSPAFDVLDDDATGKDREVALQVEVELAAVALEVDADSAGVAFVGVARPL
jgi:hypothetical protein